MKIRSLPFVILSFFIFASACGASVTVEGNQTENIGKKEGIREISGMSTSRAAHSATLLPNGKVLVAGGFAGDKNSVATAEIYDPKTNTFSSAGNMNFARASHTSTALPDGQVLIAGGFNGSYLDSAEIYDERTNKFTLAGKMSMPRSEQIAVLLASGKILLAGGVGTGWTFLADAELYDPKTNTFTKTGSMTTARESHTATLLTDGNVLVTGGHHGRRSAITIYQSAEIYDVAVGRFTATANLTVKRHKHDATRLADGTVLIVGGSDERDAGGAYNTTEIYDPKTKTFSKFGEMKLSRYKLNGTTVLLKNGKLLITGGANRAEIFDPATNTFNIVAGRFETMRLFATATLLPNGQVLIVGGYDNNNAVSSKAWIYKAG